MTLPTQPTSEAIEAARLEIEKAGRHLKAAAAHLGRQSFTLRVELIPDQRKLTASPDPSPQPSRTRTTTFAPALPRDLDDTIGTSSLDQEMGYRQRAALAFSKAHERNPDHRTIGRPLPHLFAWGALEWRTRHHPECGFHGEGECDCEAKFIMKAGGRTWKVEPDGTLEPHVEPKPTPARLRFYTPGKHQPILSHLGFSNQLDRDRHGIFWVPEGTAVIFGSAAGEDFILDIDSDANSFQSICDPKSLLND